MAITGKTRVVGVWGYPVAHSLSPVMQNAALAKLGLDWVYVPFTVDPGTIRSAVDSVRSLGLVGVNVTVPLKELIGPLLDEIDPTAAGINSVNTIVNNDGTLRGYSTDGEGLLWDLQDKGAMPSPASSVLVLGAGGAARAIVYAFVKQGFTVSISNRTIVRAQRLAADLDVDARVIEWSSGSLSAAARRAALVVNTTTLGMHDSGIEDLAIFEPDCITTGQTLYDIVYAPPETAMMKIARGGGAKAFNGLGMLVRQGALSLKLWTGLDLSEMPVEAMEIALAEYLP